MNKESVGVVAKFIARPENVTELTSVLLGLVRPTRKEKGCVSYQLLQNTANECEFVFIEEWESIAALEAHFTTPHLQEALEKAKPLLAKILDVRKYSVVEPPARS